ncbi:MAG TPA: hypothetical protein DCS93_29830 [Microscillaceae bacterium]|nr:hypothetical protein [Microscillaceae bacterium]
MWNNLHLSISFIVSIGCIYICSVGFAQKAELVVQTGHYKKINHIIFSPDGKHLASASEDKSLKVWDLTTGKEFRTMRGHKRGVRKLAFSPDGKILASGGDRYDGSIIFWDWVTGKKLHTFKKAHGSHITVLKFSKDGKRLYSGSYREMKVWDVNTKKLLFKRNDSRKRSEEMLLKHSVNAIALSPNQKIFATGSGRSGSGGDIFLWDARTFKVIKHFDLKGSKSYATALMFSKNGKILYNTGPLGMVLGRNIKTGKIESSFENAGHGYPCPCGFSPDKKYVYSACASKWSIQDMKTGKPIYSVKDAIFGYSSIAFNITNQTFAVAGQSTSEKYLINLYYTQTGRFIRSLKGYPGQITSVQFSHNNFKIASGNYQRPTRVWEINGGGGFKNFVEGAYSKRGDITSTVAFSNDDKILYNGIQGRIYAWRTTDGKMIKRIMKGSHERRNIVLTPDGKNILHNSGSALLWDAKTGTSNGNLGRARNMTRSIAVSPQGNIYYAGGYKEIKRWDAKTLKELPALKPDGYIWEIAVSPDGKTLATRDFGVSLRDATTGALLKRLKGNNIQAPTFSLDGQLLAIAHGDDIKLLNATTFNVVHTLKSHTDVVNALHFSYDNRLLVSGSEDTSLKLWDVKTGKLVATLHALDNEDFIITTPELYYMTTKGGLKGVAFRVKDKVFPFEQFDLQYNRPDLVLQKIGYASKKVIKAYKRAYQKRLQKLGFNESRFNKDFHLPTVRLLTRKLPVNTSKKQLLFKIKAEDTKYTLDRLHVYVNDTPINGIKGIDLSRRRSQNLEQKMTLELSNGLNKIQVSVMNDKGVESLQETFEINYDGQKVTPNLYVIALGISKYKTKKMNLNYARKDAQDVVKALLQKKAQYTQIIVDTLFDKNATTVNIKKLKQRLNTTRVDDRVIVFIASHGLLDEKLDYYLAMHDVNFRNPSEKGLPYEDLEGLLDGIPARNKVLMIDACHSGEIDKQDRQEFKNNTNVGTISARGFTKTGQGKTKTTPKESSQKNSDDFDFDVADYKQVGLGNSFDLMKKMFADLRRNSGATVISAAGGMEYALEGNLWKNGVFTYCLLSGMKNKEADLNNDGKVMLSELQKYLKTQVPKVTNGKQQPTSRVENLSVDFRIW